MVTTQVLGMPMMLPTGLTSMALALPLESTAKPLPIAVRYLGNNGSLPPPYRRSTEIVIDADGQGVLRRRHGYDLTDRAQLFEQAFSLTPTAMESFGLRMAELGAMDHAWREQSRPPVGGSVILVRLTQGDQVVEVPAFPIASQQELAGSVRAAVMALVPDSVSDARERWESDKPEFD